MNYTDSYTDNRVTPEQPIESFTSFDANVSYSTDNAGLHGVLSGIQVAVGVINLFNEDPPSVLRDPAQTATRLGYDPANADPRGRFVYFDVRKRF